MSNENELTYSIFGFNLRSNLPIPGLTNSAAHPGIPIVRIQLQVFPPWTDEVSSEREELFYVSTFLGVTGGPALRIWKDAAGRYLHLNYDDGMEFWLDREGNCIWGIWPPGSSIQEASTYLLGPVLGLLLRLRGVTCLHASAVVIGSRAVAFVGSAGAGKSTTAAALARSGHLVLSDDIVALAEMNGRFCVMPAYPYLSLWPESVNMLYGSPEALPRFLSDWDKRYLGNGSGGVKFAKGAVPLAVIYLLGERTGGPAPSVEAVPQQEALISLVANTYATNTLDSRMRGTEFEVLGRLVSAVPIRRLRAHEDPMRIDDLCHIVQKDVEAFPSENGVASPER